MYSYKLYVSKTVIEKKKTFVLNKLFVKVVNSTVQERGGGDGCVSEIVLRGRGVETAA